MDDPQTNLFASMLAEDEVMRNALQKIWEMGQDFPKEDLTGELEEVFEIVDEAVAQLDKQAEDRRRQMRKRHDGV